MKSAKQIRLLRSLFVTWGVLLLLAGRAAALSVVLEEVPAYYWYHGCGPTAAASLFGYYDLKGYDNLFTASGWDTVRQTWSVQDQISSPDHNEKYDSPDDRPDLPAPPDTSIADFFHTSEDLPFGWSYQHYADDAFIDYAAHRGYHDWDAWWEDSTLFSWEKFTFEIDSGRPMLFLVDTDQNGATDHFIPVFGYDEGTHDDGSAYWRYGCYTTWSEEETVSWFDFHMMGDGIAWGIGYATYVQPGLGDPVPEAATGVLFCLGLTMLTLVRLVRPQTGRQGATARMKAAG